MGRDRAIDAFRGLAIIGMVFFTVILKLSSDLPESLRHNVRGSMHLGDLVLPMFLFVSGLSLAYFLRKRTKCDNRDRNGLLRDVFGRFGKLALVGVSLSFFSAYGFLEMDEVMLSALLFIACVALYRVDWKVGIGIIFMINISYISLIRLGWLSIFTGHYLGGYPAAFYYLPVMLVGLMLGKGIVSDRNSNALWCRANKILLGIILLLLIIFCPLTPINKIPASPSYIMLSILFSSLVFAVIAKVMEKVKRVHEIGAVGIGELEYIGRKPLRYWLMMYIVFIIPARFYIEFSGQAFPMHVHWPIGIAISIGLVILLWCVSHVIDRQIK